MALIAGLWTTPAAYADGTGSGQDSGDVVITSDITDTENLLGSDLSTVNDAIDSTKERTGVSVRLLYLASFNTDKKPETWARGLLDSTDPSPNTVLLAVASQDGSLVVAASSNSDGWLRNQDTVDQLSQAALEPLVKGDSPDWSGAALAMMDKIAEVSQQAKAPSPALIGVIIAASVLVVAAVVAVVVITLRRRRRKHRRRHPRGRHRGGNKPSANIQENISDRSDGGAHEQTH